jgi:uncharacterized membrane protein
MHAARVHDERPTARAMVIAAIAGIGFLCASNLLVARVIGGHGYFCRAGSDCAAVHAGRYAVFLGLPSSGWGSALYAVVATLALAGLSARRWLAAFVLSVVGMSFSAYLAYLAFFVIGAACGYCVASTMIATALVAALVARRSRVAPQPRLLPAPLVALTLAVVVATVTVAAVVFAMSAPR